MAKLFILSALFLFFNTNAQECLRESAGAYQQQLNSEYADPNKSPLLPGDLKDFTSLDFYPIDMEFCVEARFVRTPDEKSFGMQTTTSRKPEYVKFGEVHFELKGKQCRLDVFQNIELVKQDEYKNHLFLPFTDLTSGEGSYAGGRYIDLEQPQADIMIIDFNKSYNPYCVYNYKYSCPVPPAQNDLDVEVKAGVMMYSKKKK